MNTFLEQSKLGGKSFRIGLQAEGGNFRQYGLKVGLQTFEFDQILVDHFDDVSEVLFVAPMNFAKGHRVEVEVKDIQRSEAANELMPFFMTWRLGG